MEQYYVALIPEKRLTDLINKQKSLIREMIGEQIYLSHPPHFTLIIFTTDNLNEIAFELKKISEKTNKVRIYIKDFHIFYNDLFTNGNTITYAISDETLEYLKKIQLKTIEKINYFNTKKLYSKEDEAYKKMSEIEKSNTDKYGYPFIGENWIPHITIASINTDKFEKVFEKIKQKPAFGEFLIDSINLYKVGEKTSELIRRFDLK